MGNYRGELLDMFFFLINEEFLQYFFFCPDMLEAGSKGCTCP